MSSHILSSTMAASSDSCRRTVSSRSSMRSPPTLSSPIKILHGGILLALANLLCKTDAFIGICPLHGRTRLRRVPALNLQHGARERGISPMRGQSLRSWQHRRRLEKGKTLTMFSIRRSTHIQAFPEKWCLCAAKEGAGLSVNDLDDVDMKDFVDLSDGRKACIKRVDRPGKDGDGNPARRSKVRVRYSMRVLGGDEIGTSGGDESAPFEFRLGKWPSEAIYGWDKAVSSMHKGEVATLICAPQYAFGSAGAPPKIPPNATIETKLELVDWLDMALTYNAIPGKVETDAELRDRWTEELAAGIGPMRQEAGIEKQMQDEIRMKESAMPGDRDHRNKKIYDLGSDEARAILARQKVQGYTSDFGYVEKASYLDLYIPVPPGTRAKDVSCEIHPDRMSVSVEGKGVITTGSFEGRVALDGCYWLMTDLSLDTPSASPGNEDEIRQGPRNRGEICVQVFLEKQKPFDSFWSTVFHPREDVQTAGPDVRT